MGRLLRQGLSYRAPYRGETVRLLAVTVALLTLLLAGCGLHHVANSSFLTLHVKNNTPPTVTLVDVGIPGSNQRLYNGEGVYDSSWRNDHPGVALVRVISGGKTLGCLKVHYRKGQQHATALVSQAKPCA